MFCVACGAPLSGPAEFCGKCGTRAGQAPFTGTAAAPIAAAKPAGGSALKIVLIVVGVLFVFGVLAIGGIYYTARSYVKLAENVTGVSAGDVVSTIRDAANHTSGGASGHNRDGCALLSKEEASAILGLEVERIDGKPNEHESGEHCDYFVKPETIEENAEKLKQAAAAIPSDTKTDANQLPPGAIDMIKTMQRGVIEAARNGEAPYFAFTVERENGKLACSAFKIANRLGGGDLVDGGAPEPLGVGDQAVMGMGDSRLCVVQGGAAVTLDLSQVTGGRAKGVALARTMLTRL
jgi:hypothetical protein